MYHIYNILSPSGKIYVDCSTNIKQRMKFHKNTTHANLRAEIDKYGFDSMECKIVESYKNRNDALLAESSLIAEMQGKNISLNGNCGDWSFKVSIPESTKKDFQKLCSKRGSNMSVELKRFIYEELKKQELDIKEK